MTGKGLYRVGKKSDYTTIQSAIDALISDQGNSVFTSEQRIIIQDNEVYEPFYIPDDSLSPTPLYRLTIQGKEGVYPIIDGSISSTNSYGIRIGKNNPFITVQRIYVQGFYVGILVDSNSHYFELDQCFLKGNANTNLLATFVDNISISNSLALNGDYCIALHECKDISLVQNTLFNDGSLKANASSYSSCLYLKLARDYGGGVSDSGYAWVRNNIIVNLNSDAIIYFENDIIRRAILSDYNNIFAPNGNYYKVLKDGTNTSPRNFSNKAQLISSLQLERNSIFSDPIFFKPLFTNNIQDGYKLDFTLLLDSPVVAAGESYQTTPLNIPSWINTLLFLKDFENGLRPTDKNPTIGAIEADGVYDLISDPDTIPNFAKCNTNPYQPIIDSFKETLWFPQIKEGHFFSNERKYYLYADKQAYRLSDLAVTEFRLPVQITLRKPIEIYLKGEKLSQENFDVYSNVLILYHKDLEINDLTHELSFKGYYARWIGSSYQYILHEQIIRISSGVTRFFLKEPYYLSNGSPVVLTDDKASLNDLEALAYNTFSLQYSEEYQLPEIEFGLNKNKIQNPQFDYIEDGVPVSWNISGNVSATGTLNSVYPLKGDHFCYLTGNSSISSFIKLADFTGEKPNYFWTWHSRNNSNSSWTIKEYDSQGRVKATHNGEIPFSSDWKRYECQIGEENLYIETYSGLSDSTQVLSSYIPIDNQTTDLELIFSTSKVGYFDCVQFEAGDRATKYHRLPYFQDITVEYEGSESGFYRVEDLSLSPISNHNNNGFLAIQNISGKTLDKLAPESATTLSEYRWQNGRLNVIPWSRITGIDKLVFRPILKEDLGKGEFEKSPLFEIPKIETIGIYPTTFQSLQDSNGDYFYVELFDNYNNPGAFENCNITVSDPAGEYPGSLTITKYSIPVSKGVNLSGETDSAGKLYAKWTPPESSDVIYVGLLPSGSQNNFIDTKYRISPINYGNIKIYNDSDDLVNTIDTAVTTGVFPISQTKDFSYISLPYYPAYGTVEVKYQGEQWSESSYYKPLEKEFQVVYRQKMIRLNGLIDGFAEVEFKKSLAWIQPEYGRRIFFSDSLLNSFSGSARIYYDAELFLSVSSRDGIITEFSMIAQSPK